LISKIILKILDQSASEEQLKKLSKFVKYTLRKEPKYQADLADLYLEGINGESYEELAASWYLLAAKNNSAYAQYMLSIFFQQGLGLPQDLKQSVAWYKRASENKNSSKAKVRVAKRYLSPYSILHDEKQAALWMEAAAMQGNIQAQYLLGDMYIQGRGVTKSAINALAWYGKAAAQGSSYAQYSLGVMYYNGQGVAQNLQDAHKWLYYAANQGYTEAQYLLGRMYEQGFGVEKSLPKAYAWWQMIPKDNIMVDDFDRKMSGLIANMTPKEKLQADQLTKKYRKKVVG